MLLYPAIDELKTKVDSKYTLVIMASKRARDLTDGKPKLTVFESPKPLSIATQEVYEDVISYKREQAPAAEAAAETPAEAEEAPLAADTEIVDAQ